MSNQLKLLDLDDNRMLEKVQQAMHTSSPAILEMGKAFIKAARVTCAKMGLNNFKDADDDKLIQALLHGINHADPQIQGKARSIIVETRTEFRNIVTPQHRTADVVPVDPRLLEVPENEKEIDGLVEFKKLLGEKVGAEATILLEYLQSQDWRNGIADRSYLPIKAARVFQKFWQTLGTIDEKSFRTQKPREFEELHTALKRILRHRDMQLAPFQEVPGKFEHQIDWYEAQPRVTFYQSSQVEAVVQPGLLGSDGQPELHAIVKIKKD